MKALKMMAKIFPFLALILTVECLQKKRPTFRQNEYYKPTITQEVCSNEADKEYSALLEEASCGTPKNVLIPLYPPSRLEHVLPSAAWVKRCIGICDLETNSSTLCVPGTVNRIPIYTRIYNARLKKQRCATYDVEEHVDCHCPS